MDAVYKNERPLFVIALLISLLVWGVLIVVTFGIALLYVLLFFVIYLFVQSAFISYLKGTAVHITAAQFPDLHQLVERHPESAGIASLGSVLTHVERMPTLVSDRERGESVGRRFRIDATSRAIQVAGVFAGARVSGAE